MSIFHMRSQNDPNSDLAKSKGNSHTKRLPAHMRSILFLYLRNLKEDLSQFRKGFHIAIGRDYATDESDQALHDFPYKILAM
jgi:hypothetical protein